MKDKVESRGEIENMRTDALIAIDALKAIVAECDSQYVSRRYLKEKVNKVISAVGYISAVALEED